MKTQIVFLIVALLMITSLKAQVKIGDNPQNLDPASVLELESSNRVLVITRVTTAQMSTINPLRGALVYNTDEECIHYYNGVEWINICEALDNSFTVSTNAIFNTAPDARDSTVVVTQTETPDGINYNFEVNRITGDNVYNGTLFGSDLAAQSIGVRELQNGGVGLEKLEDGTLAGQLIQWDGDSWELITDADLNITEGDGEIGNEVTDATAGGSLELNGGGTELDPYTLDIADDGVTAAKINGDVAGIGLLQNGTTGALDVDYANIEADWTNIANIPPDIADGDNQDLSIGVGGTANQSVEVLISNGTSAIIDIQDGDFDPNNEIQDAIDVDFDDTASTLGQTTVQGAIDALAASNAADGDTDDQNEIQDAIDVDFDDTASTLGETTVQGAIDALAASNAADGDTDDTNEIQNAAGVEYDDTASTLGQTTVQGAIDALAASNAADGDTDDQNEIQDAVDVNIDDAGGNFTATEVEGALAELAASNAADGDTDDQNEIQDAVDVNIDDAGGNFTATEVEGALTELAASNAANTTAISNILSPVVAGKINATGNIPLSELNITSVDHTNTGIYTVNFADLGSTNYVINTSVESNGTNDVILNISAVNNTSFTVEIKEIEITDTPYPDGNGGFIVIPTAQTNLIDKNWSFTIINF